MRTFIAGILSKDLKDSCLAIQEEFKRLELNVKWIEPQNIHLTFKFLGEIPEDVVSKIKVALQDLFKDEPAIRTAIHKLGVFPRLKSPRVLWVGLEDKEGRLRDYFLRIEGALKNIGLAPEKRGFKPHITLGRFRSLKNISGFIKKAESLEIKPLGGYITQIVFFKSQLTPQGPIYTPLEEIILKIHHDK